MAKAAIEADEYVKLLLEKGVIEDAEGITGDGPSNALRHSLWMAIAVVNGLDPEKVLELGQVNEMLNYSGRNDAIMDTHNNATGVQAGMDALRLLKSGNLDNDDFQDDPKTYVRLTLLRSAFGKIPANAKYDLWVEGDTARPGGTNKNRDKRCIYSLKTLTAVPGHTWGFGFNVGCAH